MEHISSYEQSVVITLLPNPMKHIATLRIEINPSQFENEDYIDKFDKLCYFFRCCGFSVNVDKNLAFNSTDLPNVIEFILPPYASEVKIAKDVSEELKQVFGDNSVLNRVMIKEKLKK